MLAPEDRDARRQRYVDAVWRIAERDGVERASMRAIAAEAGTSVGMLQHHFTDKDEILVVAISSRLEAKSARLARTVRQLGPDADPAEVLAVALRHRLPLTRSLLVEAQVLALWLAADVRSPLKTAVLAQSEQELCEVIVTALTDAQAQGRLADGVDIDGIAGALIALNDGLMHGLVLGRYTSRRANHIIQAQIGALLNEGTA
jgi:TetR/AcrR family transcriptional regulator, transcriptional repressor of bet genes